MLVHPAKKERKRRVNAANDRHLILIQQTVFRQRPIEFLSLKYKLFDFKFKIIKA